MFCQKNFDSLRVLLQSVKVAEYDESVAEGISVWRAI